MPEIIFNNLRSSISINGDFSFSGGRFVPDYTSNSSIPNSNPQKKFQNLNGIAITIPRAPADHNDLQSLAFSALEFAQGILAAMAVRFQTHMYFEPPIRFTLDGINYLFHEDFVEEQIEFEQIHFMGGGDGFCESLAFLNNPRNNRLIFDFYREATNESNSLDYRILQLWRFLEGWFGIKDMTLVNHIISLMSYQTYHGYNNLGIQKIKTHRITRRLIKGFYSFCRCAVSHGGGSSNPRHTNKIIIPRRIQLDDKAFWIFHDMLDITDYIIRTRKNGKKS